MNQCQLLRTCISLLLACALLGASERPNIFLVLPDDEAYGDLHPLGQPPYFLPNVRKLAAEGICFTRFHVPHAVCSTSRATLFIGRYPHHTKVVIAIGPRHEGLDPARPIIGETSFREQKGTSFEGGIRSSPMVQYPGKPKDGAVNERTICSIELYLTLASLSGTAFPEDAASGKNVRPLICNEEICQNILEFDFISTCWQLEAVFAPDGKCKLSLPHVYGFDLHPGHQGGRGETATACIEESSFNLGDDLGEKTNILTNHMEISNQPLQAAFDHLKNIHLLSTKKFAILEAELCLELVSWRSA